MSLLYKADPVRGAEWKALVAARRPDLPVHVWPETGDPAAVRYLAIWTPPDAMLQRFPNTEIIFSVGAGVDQFDASALPEHIPLVRMLDPAIVEGMVEYATLSVLALHRHLPDYIEDRARRLWQPRRLVTASARRVGILGLGRLGESVARKLAGFGFPVTGWSRGARAIPGIDCRSGAAGLDEVVSQSDILVCLLPLTQETRHILDRELFRRMPRGAGLINAGRGAHLVQEHLLEALDEEHLSGAVLDVTDPEPLPEDHPFWRHPRIIMTPHVASMTNPRTAVEFVLETIERHRRGLPLEGLVERGRGY